MAQQQHGGQMTAGHRCQQRASLGDGAPRLCTADKNRGGTLLLLLLHVMSPAQPALTATGCGQQRNKPGVGCAVAC